MTLPPFRRLPSRSSKLVDLGLLTVRISSNLEEFDAYAYFSREADGKRGVDYEIHCVDLDRDAFDTDELDALRDRSLRAKRFRAGYYLNHIFGDPAYLITGRSSYVFGRRLERTVWPYFVKRLLTDFALDHGYLHLKAGGFALDDGGVTLLVGPNGGGKTVFLNQACLHGARFLTNTHALVRDGRAFSVPSSIRVRRDAQFGPLIDRYRLVPHIERGDYVASSELLFPGGGVDSGPVRNVVITDYNTEGARGFELVTAEQAETFLEQFSFAVTNYGLRDDVLAHYAGDFEKFTGGMREMRGRLKALVHEVPCYRANVDMLDHPTRDHVLATLGSGRGA
jgi:hypothetical protein